MLDGWVLNVVEHMWAIVSVDNPLGAIACQDRRALEEGNERTRAAFSSPPFGVTFSTTKQCGCPETQRSTHGNGVCERRRVRPLYTTTSSARITAKTPKHMCPEPQERDFSPRYLFRITFVRSRVKRQVLHCLYSISMKMLER